jgi:hypothetical protein
MQIPANGGDKRHIEFGRETREKNIYMKRKGYRKITFR